MKFINPKFLTIGIIVLIIIHGLFNTYFQVDNTTVLLFIILLILPYISKITKLKFGDIEATFDRDQGKSDPIPPQFSALPQNIQKKSQFTSQERKIISTLYKYQKQSFSNDITKRWTFIITPNFKEEYPDYLTGISGLLKKGLIAVSPENYHCMLTNEGLDYIEKNISIYDEKIVYTF